ncbi:MAG: cob(I)yrinic acid a,c-diamide adenosyltransferase [Bacteroidales bacterium]
MKIYTKTGDTGDTSLIGGRRVPKYDNRIEAYGTVDELISWIGLIRDQDIDPSVVETMLVIQDKLMVCASILAADCEDCPARIPELKDSDTEFLEQSIDRMETELQPLSSFILPGGHTIVSWCHIARSVCRRAERNTLKLSVEFTVEPNVVRYLNRLSDYLFVLSRKLGKDFNAVEIPWKPGLEI